MCCMTLHNDNKIVFAGLEIGMINKIHTTIERNWDNSKKECTGTNTYKFKLSGVPWSTFGPAAVKARSLFLAILRVMAEHGWSLLQAPDMATFSVVQPTYYFEFKGIVNPGVTIFAMSYCCQNMIRIIDGPEVLSLVHKAIATHWPPG